MVNAHKYDLLLIFEIELDLFKTPFELAYAGRPLEQNVRYTV
jgi:hypothetical protein